MRYLPTLILGVVTSFSCAQSAPSEEPASTQTEPNTEDSTAAPDATDEPRDVLPPKERTLGDDKHKRYFLHKPEGDAPDGGWPLLIILPGGDGSADFKGFVNAIARNALDGRYLVAQPVAPVWTRGDNRIVWPTSRLPDGNMQFPTESFLDEIHAQLSEEFELDASRCFLLGWSSGGPPSYYATLREDTPFRGAMVAMSVYKAQNLPRKKDAKGKAFYILHSPEDFIAMRFPKLAELQLRSRGAATTLVEYEGGHGWHGDVHGMISDGIAWLEQNSE